jgi:hypothetical protein
MRKKTHISHPTFSKKKKGGVARRAIAMYGRGGLFCKSKNTILKYVDNFVKKTTPSLRATPPIHFVAGGEMTPTELAKFQNEKENENEFFTCIFITSPLHLLPNPLRNEH